MTLYGRRYDDDDTVGTLCYNPLCRLHAHAHHFPPPPPCEFLQENESYVPYSSNSSHTLLQNPHNDMITKLLVHPQLDRWYSCSRDGVVRSWNSSLHSVIREAQVTKSWITDMAIHTPLRAKVDKDRYTSGKAPPMGWKQKPQVRTTVASAIDRSPRLEHVEIVSDGACLFLCFGCCSGLLCRTLDAGSRLSTCIRWKRAGKSKASLGHRSRSTASR